jgi:hypothetical protein
MIKANRAVSDTYTHSSDLSDKSELSARAISLGDLVVNDPAVRLANHLQRAGQQEQALEVLEQGAEAADDIGDLGRAGTLYLTAFRMARSDQGLSPRSNALEIKAIGHLYLARRWTELDPLIHDAWSRRDGLSDQERAWLAMPLAWLAFSRGRIADSWNIIQDELTQSDGIVPSLNSQAAYVAWRRAGVGARTGGARLSACPRAGRRTLDVVGSAPPHLHQLPIDCIVAALAVSILVIAPQLPTAVLRTLTILVVEAAAVIAIMLWSRRPGRSWLSQPVPSSRTPRTPSPTRLPSTRRR